MRVIGTEQKIIRLYSTKFELSECENDPDVYIGKFIICDFMPNANGVQIDRATISEWLPTLVNKPLVGKVITTADGTKDFSSHNMKIEIKTDDDGNKYESVEFDTAAFGTMYEALIESIDGVEYIVASAKIWKRFSEACEVIKERAAIGKLNTSWEITVLKDRVKNFKGLEISVIEQGSFFGHCLLGKSVIPAYSSSRLLGIAAKKPQTDNDLETALIRDVCKMAQKGENDKMSENSVKTAETNEKNTKTSALTDWDLREKIREACKIKLGKWCWLAYHFPIDKTVWIEVEDRESELDYVVFTYTTDNEVVTVSEPTAVKLTVSVSQVNTTIEKLESDIKTRDKTIIELNSKLQKLTTEVSSLNQYREQFEEAEQEKIRQETAAKKKKLKDNILKSGAFTSEDVETSDEIKAMIENLDESGINRIIVEKIISSLELTEQTTGKNDIQTAEAKANKTLKAVKTNIVDTAADVNESEDITPNEFISSFISK